MFILQFLPFNRRASSLVKSMFASLLCAYAFNAPYELFKFISLKCILPTVIITDKYNMKLLLGCMLIHMIF